MVCKLAAFGYDFDAFNQGFHNPLLKALGVVDAISTEHTYKQMLLESVVDMLPAWVISFVLTLPMRTGRVLRKELDVMRSVAKELYELGLEAAKDGDHSTRKDLLSLCGPSPTCPNHHWYRFSPLSLSYLQSKPILLRTNGTA